MNGEYEIYYLSLVFQQSGLYDTINVPVLLQQVVIALTIGGLIGLEREIGEDENNKFAGLRTLALLCGTGPIMVRYAELIGHPIVISLYIGLGIAFSLGILYIRFKLTGSDVGLTTSVTVFLVTLLGVLVGYGQYFEAIAIAIITAFLLAEKDMMMKYAENLTYEELTDSMKLGALVFILYPILPSEPVDPFGVVIPREVLLFAIFVLLIEFLAYISMRQFGGSKGLQVTGFLAGMANSFATAGVMARMANQSDRAIDSASSGIMLSVISMILRNVGLASVLAVAIFTVVWIPAVVMLSLAAVIAFLLLRIGDDYDDLNIDLDSPFSFKAAVKFAAIYILITVVSVVAQEQLGDVGLLATAFTGGLVSSAAVAVSAATLVNEGATTVEAGGGMVILGIIASLTSKIVLVEMINGQMRDKAMLPMATIGVVGLIVYFLVP